MSTRRFRIVPVGSFSLRESIGFGFGQRVAAPDEVMRLAFCLDGGFESHVGVEVRQDGSVITGVVHGDGDLDRIRRQVARVLSLDHDARDFDALGDRDPVLGRLLRSAPGLRPPLFYSPYEAAFWGVYSMRRGSAQMTRARTALSEQWGTTFELAGQPLAALPTPQQLLRLDTLPGVEPARLGRIHAVARAAADGRLESDRLLRMGPDEAVLDLQRINGIGPFWASLIVIRATGFADVLPVSEPRLLGLVQQLWGLPGPPSVAEFSALAEAWRPFRTWASVLVRAAAPRLLTAGASTAA